MTADELADKLVLHFNALTGLPLAFQATKPADIAEVEAERTELGIFVVPKDEREEPIDRGDACRRERVVSVAANGPVRDQLTLAKYLKTMELLRTSLEGTTFDDYEFDGNETLSLWDRETLRVRGRFMALFESTYFRFS